MTTLERYILRQLLGPLGFFVLVLTAVVWLTQSLRIIDIVVNNGQGAQVFLEFTVLLLPLVLSIVLQLGALAATVYTLHRLLTESEMIAALATGASRLRLARPVAVFGGLVMAMMALDTLYLMPTAKQVMRERVAEVRGDLAAGLIRDGRFLHPAPGLTVYIREITADGHMLGILLRDNRDENESVIYTAKRGFLARDGDAPTLVLREGVAQRLENDGDRLSMLRFETFAYDLSFFVQPLENRYRKPSERYVHELIFADPETARSRKEYGRLIAEGHEQLSAPLYALALPLLAAALMLSAGYSRRGPAGAVVLALAAGAALRVVGLGMKSLVTSAPELWPLLYAPPLLAIAAAIGALSISVLSAGRGARNAARHPRAPEVQA